MRVPESASGGPMIRDEVKEVPVRFDIKGQVFELSAVEALDLVSRLSSILYAHEVQFGAGKRSSQDS